jgi:hypothetical protein
VPQRLELDREVVNLFVFGPGEGEALALWLPRHGWLFVDCCRRRLADLAEVVPQIWLRKALADDAPVWGAMLTHPHEDHVEGFPDLLRASNPERVFVSGTIAPRTDLVRACESALQASASSPNDTKCRNLAKAVHAAAMAIREWEAATGRAVAALHAGASVLEDGNLRIDCVAPEERAIQSMLQDAKPDVLAAQANHLSAVLVVSFGSARVLLTGDLPWLLTGTPIPASDQPATRGVVAGGWETVAANHDLTHCCMKVPHHGSREALHPMLLAAPARPRFWSVTPKNRSALPKFWGAANGVDALLAAEERLFVTALPSGWIVESSLDETGVVRRANLRRRTAAMPTGDPFVDAGDDVRPTPVDARQTVWAFIIGANGVVRRARGASAIEVIR